MDGVVIDVKVLADLVIRQAESALYAELDKLSAAWEALDRQVKSKVFDLAAMEDRLSKNALDVSFTFLISLRRSD